MGILNRRGDTKPNVFSDIDGLSFRKFYSIVEEKGVRQDKSVKICCYMSD